MSHRAGDGPSGRPASGPRRSTFLIMLADFHNGGGDRRLLPIPGRRRRDVRDVAVVGERAPLGLEQAGLIERSRTTTPRHQAAGTHPLRPADQGRAMSSHAGHGAMSKKTGRAMSAARTWTDVAMSAKRQKPCPAKRQKPCPPLGQEPGRGTRKRTGKGGLARASARTRDRKPPHDSFPNWVPLIRTSPTPRRRVSPTRRSNMKHTKFGSTTSLKGQFPSRLDATWRTGSATP